MWKIGDEAVCIDDVCGDCGHKLPIAKDVIYTVVAVQMGYNVGAGGEVLFLKVDGAVGKKHYCCNDDDGEWWDAGTTFRKVVRDQAQGEAKDWQLLLDSMKPKVDA